MRKNSTTADGAVPRSRNRSSAINNGSRSVNASGIRGMNGCGDLLPLPLIVSTLGDCGVLRSRTAHRQQPFSLSPFCVILGTPREKTPADRRGYDDLR